MTAINLILAVGLAIGLVFYATDRAMITPSPYPSLFIGITYIVLWVIQPILVYKWSKEHNKKLQEATTVNT